MRFIYRWMANTLGFYLGLYLVDTLIAQFAFIKKGWIAIVLAVLMGAINSTIRPFPGFKNNRGRAFGFFGITALGNYLFMQIIAWVGAPLYRNPLGLMFAAVFLTLLGGLMNHVVGFKPKEESKVITREHRISDITREHQAERRNKRRKKRPKRD